MGYDYRETYEGARSDLLAVSGDLEETETDTEVAWNAIQNRYGNL